MRVDGYTGRPGLTAQRFVPDPFSTTGERLYRTGDLARQRHDGQLEYHGRTDDQIKIRGHRIELDDIRHTIESHPDVTAAAVLAHDHPAGGSFLTAYVTGGTTDADRLRAWTAAALPEYMIPAVFIQLDTLPVTVNGKLDRHALPVPDLSTATGHGQAPSTPTQIAVADAFTHVLNLGPDTALSTDDDFFHLGGHSLLATQAVARLNAVLEHHAHPARRVRPAHRRRPRRSRPATLRRTGQPTGPSIRDVVRGEPLLASHGQQALWLSEQIDSAGFYRTGTVLTFRGPVDLPALHRAVRRLRERHEILRTHLRPGRAGRPRSNRARHAVRG